MLKPYFHSFSTIFEYLSYVPELIFRYVKTHYMHNLNQTPNFNHLGHPLNAYHLIRHVASGWNYLIENEFKNIPEIQLKHEFGKSNEK